MKAYKTICLAALATFGLSTAAAAQTVTPVSTNFTASGPTSLTSGGTRLNCTSTFRGTTSADGRTASITSASLAGFGCGLVSATNLPWTVTAQSTTAITVSGVAVNVPFATCGPSNLSAAYNNATGQMTFANAPLAPNCSVTGTLTTSPTLTIVP